MVKLAAARANYDCGQFSQEILRGIEGACQEIIDGKLHDQFRLDVFQGGAGTSTNMNANEVIANRALELMGHAKGEYQYCSPHDHVNGSQSTNDAYPTSLHVGLALGNIQLIACMKELIAAFRAKGKEFASIIKMGRTQLQDAVPMTLGQEFEAFAETLAGEVETLEMVQCPAHRDQHGRHGHRYRPQRARGYAEKCTEHLAKITGFPIRPGAESHRGHPGHPGVRPVLLDHRRAWPSSCPRSATTCGCSPPARAAACTRSTCRRCSRARRSCPARSTRSSPRSSTWSASA